ncbi:hypothetical protein G3I15_45500, partial [Streptomyces sp. SID10244]|nr:hypothetical protein [Streptomyces sp. SID10244]
LGGLPDAAARTDIDLPDGARWASSVVTCRPSVRGAVEHVLADTVLVDTAEQGLDIAQRHRVRTVTLDGDRIGPGSIEGGSSHRPSTLEVQSAIDAATSELAGARRRLEEIEAAL